MGQRKIQTAEELEERVSDFIARVETGEIDAPTDYRLAGFLGVSVDTLGRYETEEGYINEGFPRALKNLRAYREHFYLRLAQSREGASIGIFALKQPRNGGYKDKQDEDKTPIKIDVTINGAGNDPFG